MLYTTKKYDQRVKSKLKLNKRITDIICHPLINNLEFDGFKLDSVELLKSEVSIFLKNSFNWNVEAELPFIPRSSVIKALLKRIDHLTEDEWKILKYMEFYSQIADEKYIEKFICNQLISVNRQDRYLVAYVLQYNADGQLKVVDQSIEKQE